MYKKVFLIAISILFWGYSSVAQTTEDEAYQKSVDKISNMSAKEKADYYRTYHSKKPNAEQMEKLRNAIPAETPKKHKSGGGVEMPDKFWFPGEFEEVQAVLITWSYIHTDPTGRFWADAITKDTACWEDDNKNFCIGEYQSFVDIYDDESRMPTIFAQLADAIQQGGAQVWINIVNAADSNIIKSYMNYKGMPLTNYRFFVNPNNSFWYRDCGPVGFYYGDHDSIAFLDFEYYGGRPIDDQIPIFIGEELNIPVYTTSIEFEGGNIILDGVGTLFTSDALYDANKDIYGKYYLDGGTLRVTIKSALTKQQVNDSLSNLLGVDRIKVLPQLRYDGGTGHIDLYAAMWDENNFVFTKFPPQLSKLTDYSITSRNIDTILSMYSFFGKNYRGRDIPLPKKDNDTWYTSNADFEIYTRTYSNSTFVNDVIITPIFSDNKWGAREWDLTAIELMKKVFPGYKIIPIDIRGFENVANSGFDGFGGAIHCITKQIPAENPIRILHNAIQDFADDALYNGDFPIEATITNKSGISSATCFWRVKGANSWQSLSLTAGTDNTFSALLNRPSNLAHDTIEYYLSATSNNGKTITKPMTAPNGFYSFYHGTEAVQEEEENIYDYLDIVQYSNMGEAMKISNLFPNPATYYSKVILVGGDGENIDIRITNMLGQNLYVNSVRVEGNETVLQLNTSSFPAGTYIVSFTNSKGNVATGKLIIER